MRRILLAGAAALALTSFVPPAFADPDDAPGMAAPGRDDEGPPREGFGPHPHEGMIGPPPGPRRGPPSRGAHFRLDLGDDRVDVKCADGEPMRACADIVLQILDRIHGAAEPPPRPPHGGPEGAKPPPPDTPGPKT